MSLPEVSYRCGWRVSRLIADELMRWERIVKIRRGAWRMMMNSDLFDAIPDEVFTEMVENNYRETAFDQLQQDLDVLGQLAADVLSGDMAALAGTDWEAVKGVVYRWERAAKDIEAATL